MYYSHILSVYVVVLNVNIVLVRLWSRKSVKSYTSITGSRSGDDHLVYTYKDIFFIMKNILQMSFDEQVQRLEESLTAKNNYPFKLNSDGKVTISKLLHKFRSKWQEASRNLKTFLRQQENWLNSSIYLPVNTLFF